MTIHPAFLAALTLVAALSAAAVLAATPAARRILAESAGRDLGLDGLRGFLAFFVFVHHASVTWFFIQGQPWDKPPSRLFSQLGSASVALFFMVTAFLFWGRVLARRGDMNWNGFWIGRAFRIYPAYLLAILLILLVAFATQGFRLQTDLGTFLRALARWLAFAHPYFPDLNGLPGTGRLIAYASWTLAYEMLFYAMLPLAALAAFRASPPAAAAAAMAPSFLLASILALLATGRFLFSLPVLESFAGGIAAAHLVRIPALVALCRSPLGTALAVACLLAGFLAFDTAFTPLATLTLAAFFLVVAAGNPLLGLLHRPWALWLGQVSYSVYILHGLVLWLVCDRLFLALAAPTDQTAYIALSLAAAALLVLLASASAILVEFPAIALGRRLARRRRPAT